MALKFRKLQIAKLPVAMDCTVYALLRASPDTILKARSQGVRHLPFVTEIKYRESSVFFLTMMQSFFCMGNQLISDKHYLLGTSHLNFVFKCAEHISSESLCLQTETVHGEYRGFDSHRAYQCLQNTVVSV